MTTRNYSSRSQQTTLTSAVTAGASSMVVVSGTALLGGVTIPAGTTFTIVVDPDTAIEEILDATAVSTNSFTITRGIDGSSPQAHSAGAVVRHMAIGRDYREANAHIEATTGVHGISNSSDVVGTIDTQTLTNKTLTAPVITNPSISGAGVDASIVFEGATADAYETTLTVVDPTQDNTVTIPNTTGTVVIATAVQTLTNKTLTSPTISGSPVITGLSSAGMISTSATPKDYVDSILGSATAASTSAASAATSAASAATSATSAANSATASATSASASATSATAAATSATSAAASATAAATSATSASASATAAATSATSAAASAVTAANSVATIAGYATTASNSASAAATSATSAAASATAAATSATSAAASATAAATSASSASTSASSALTSANSAATSAASAAAVLASAVPLSVVDAKGDLIAGTAADTVGRLPIGTDGQILTADSLETTGMKWTAAPSGYLAPTLGTTTITSGTTVSTVTALTLDNATLTGTLTASASSGTSGQLLTSTGTGVEWAAAPVSLPSQTGNDGKLLTTNGTTASWAGAAPVAQTTEPTTLIDGLVWMDTDGTAPTSVVTRWSKALSAGVTVLSGNDDNSLPLSYSPGYEQVYLNGVMLSRVNDYAATSGTSITLATASVAGDIVEVICALQISTTDTYTQTQANALFPLNATAQIAGKNKIINGDFSVNQRNFSSTTTSTEYNFDRWRTIYTGGTSTTTAQVFTPGTAPVAGYEGKNYYRVAITGQSATTDFVRIQEVVESVRTFAGQTTTYSFWAKADAGTPKVAVFGVQYFGDGSPSSTVSTDFGTITLSTSWARYSITCAIPSISGKTLGTGGNDGISIRLMLSGGASVSNSQGIGIQNYTFETWGHQWEAGSVATAFSTASGTVQGELALCQRYYVRFSNDTGSVYGFFNNAGYFESTTSGLSFFTLPVEMRQAPSTVDYSSSLYVFNMNATNFTPSAITLNAQTGRKQAIIAAAVTGATTGQPAVMRSNNSTSTYIGFSAEL